MKEKVTNVTIKMLANQLGLSISTVSKAISDSHEISAATKQRVNDLVEKLNYKPNPYASSLRTRNSKTIGVVLPEVADSFFAQAINGIESVAEEKGYHVLIYLSHESFEREEQIIKDFESGRVDGVLISVAKETEQHKHIDTLLEKKIPLVFFDRVIDEVATTKIITDDYEAAYTATEHLIKQGYKQVLFLSFSQTLSISCKRLEGYKKSLYDNTIKFSSGNVLRFSNDAKKDYSNLLRKLTSLKKGIGVLASVEKLALPLYQACEELQLRIPQDVGLISFSNLDSAAFLHPPLTTITQPAFEMGKAAAAFLVKALERKNFELADEEIVIPSVMIVRKSTL
ncbi:MAG: LacI family transcriptional regulator [Ferruginibacter sp.]|uniref:LacI family DNA-binding transcriptional regulator n=1 Tax=Ferruginibacter sp. TaxID=1940288 RepID=UPI00265AF319|nr:LacI family DNA-binding transcriptional regulator [Ferruginibacter sp.]MDB5278885.1 LacI family transcriptional regulator [Ferruginibacter sp.]